MKKLFKHLAIVLALALVIGLVPARTAEAADYSLKFKNKYLYVGAKGETAHGVDSVGNLPAKPIKRSLKFGGGVIDGLKDGDVVTFKSADRAVARGSKKYQRVFAIGVGETDVAVKVNGEEIGSMHFIVKQNAKSLAIDAASEVGIGDIDINVKVEPATATDIISLVIPEEYKDIAVVKEGTTITTKKPGTFKIQAVAQQNDSTLTGYHVKSEEVELQAAVKVISAKQKSANEVIFEFDNDMTDIVDAKDFKVYYKPVNGADVTTAVEKVTVQDDPKKVVVKLWNNFLEGTEYFVEYSGQVSTFTTAKLGIANAASIRFNELEITKGKVTEYDITVLDANGVELPDDMLNYVSCSGTSTDKIQIGDKTILFDEAGLQANVTATFDAWYEDSEGNAKQNTFKNAGLFKSVDVTPVTLSKYYWTFADFAETPDAEPDDYADANHLVAVDDEEQWASLFNLLLVFSDGSTLAGAPKYDGSSFELVAAEGDTADDNFASTIAPYISLEIADPKTAEIENGIVKAVNVGTTQILVKLTTQDAPILVIPIDVKAKAVPTTMKITAENDKVKLNTNSAVFNDMVVFEVEVKDQYDRPYYGADMAVEKGSSTETVAFTDAAAMDPTDEEGLSYATFDSRHADPDYGTLTGKGVMVLKFTASDRGKTITNTTKSITCKFADGAAASYKLYLGTDTVDQVLGAARKPTHKAYRTDVCLYPLDSQGFVLADPTATAVDLFDEAAILAATGETFAFKAYVGGTEVTPKAGYAKQYVEDGYFNSVRLKAVDDPIEKLDAKTATIKLYKIVVDVKNGVNYIKSQTSIDTRTVTIKNSQPGITVKKLADKIADTNPATIAGAFKVTYRGADVAADFESAIGTKSVYVKNAFYVEPSVAVDGTNGSLVIDAPVNHTLIVD